MCDFCFTLYIYVEKIQLKQTDWLRRAFRIIVVRIQWCLFWSLKIRLCTGQKFLSHKLLFWKTLYFNDNYMFFPLLSKFTLLYLPYFEIRPFWNRFCRYDWNFFMFISLHLASLAHLKVSFYTSICHQYCTRYKVALQFNESILFVSPRESNASMVRLM